MIYHNTSIQLEDVGDYVNKWQDHFIEKYRMKSCMGPQILKRDAAEDRVFGPSIHVKNTTNEGGTYPSDNYIYEYFINDYFLGFIYCRRNSFNNCEFIVVDLEQKIPEKYYHRNHKSKINDEIKTWRNDWIEEYRES